MSITVHGESFAETKGGGTDFWFISFRQFYQYLSERHNIWNISQHKSIGKTGKLPAVRFKFLGNNFSIEGGYWGRLCVSSKQYVW